MVEVIREEGKEEWMDGKRRQAQWIKRRGTSEKEATERGPLSLPGLRWGNIRFHATRQLAAILVYAVLQCGSVAFFHPDSFRFVHRDSNYTIPLDFSCSSIPFHQAYKNVILKRINILRRMSFEMLIAIL